jgi:hypothetical protein
MSGTGNHSRVNPTVQTDPDPHFAGLILCAAYHANTNRWDWDARLYITPSGALEIHMEQGIYPVRAAFTLFTDRSIRLESDDFVPVESDEVPHRLEYMAVYIQVPKPVFVAAVDFAKSISSPPTAEGTPFIPNEVSVWQLPVQCWGAAMIAQREGGNAQ